MISDEIRTSPYGSGSGEVYRRTIGAWASSHFAIKQQKTLEEDVEQRE